MKILLVDDSAAVRARLAERLGEVDGIEHIYEADTPERALSLARMHEPEIIVLDAHLDHSSGLDLLPFLERLCPSAALIVATNQAGEIERRHALERGADAFFDKSSEFDALAATVALAVRGGLDRPRRA